MPEEVGHVHMYNSIHSIPNDVIFACSRGRSNAMALLKVNRGRISGSNDENDNNAVTIVLHSCSGVSMVVHSSLTGHRYVHSGVPQFSDITCHMHFTEMLTQ